MTESIEFGLEEKKFYVSTLEFKEKVENFQTRFHVMERANKASLIRWFVLLLLVLVVAGILGYVWVSHDKKMAIFVRNIDNMTDIFQEEQEKR